LIKCDNNRRENAAEHGWYVIIMAIILQEYLNQKINITKVMKILLIYDIVEIYAGDIYAFDDQSVLNEQNIKELEVLEKIFALLANKEAQEYKAYC